LILSVAEEIKAFKKGVKLLMEPDLQEKLDQHIESKMDHVVSQVDEIRVKMDNVEKLITPHKNQEESQNVNFNLTGSYFASNIEQDTEKDRGADQSDFSRHSPNKKSSTKEEITGKEDLDFGDLTLRDDTFEHQQIQKDTLPTSENQILLQNKEALKNKFLNNLKSENKFLKKLKSS
jgi:hypothetical protein